MKHELEFIQIVPAPWKETYTMFALARNGSVYRYDHAKCGWVRLGMKMIDNEAPNYQ